ncbi:MAG: hypothetical protein AB8G05_08165 [Oligoflexales bacterium]
MNLFHSYNYGFEDLEDIDPELKKELTKRFNLPPDPGDKGIETLFGIDADKDGLRDDVQRWIYFHYPDEPLIRKALRQLAIDHIENFKYGDNREKSVKASHKALDSVACSYDIFSLNYFKKRQTNLEEIKILKVIENTRERYTASRKSDRNFSGQSRSTPEPFTSCRFEVDHPDKEEYLRENGYIK